MPALASLRFLGLGTVLVVALSGCVFGGGEVSPKQRIGESAQQIIDGLGLRSGVEMFNDGEGFGSSYSILLCAEVPDEVVGRAAAEQAAQIVNALRGMTAEESEFVNAVQVRLVQASAGATDDDLGNWCRRQWPEQVVDFSAVATLYSSGSVRGPDFEVTVPYDVVTILEEAPAETPEPTETPAG